MNKKIQNRFFANYILMFIVSIMITFFTLILLDFANHMISRTLVKNNYKADIIMQDDYSIIDTLPVVENGGGVQIINSNYEIILSEGLTTFSKKQLTAEEFTDFLVVSQKIGVPFSYSIKYNQDKQFWLIVTFPTSFRIDFRIVYNKEFTSVDSDNVINVIMSVVIFYLILLAVSTIIYSKISSLGIVKPLNELSKSVRRLRDGEYSARVNLNLKNEFAELQDTFNSMAERIEQEISLREESEENRKKLVLDISHDLKNPLASIMGYSELCLNNQELSKEENNKYLKTIYENGDRANHLITGLFELSKMESSEFVISRAKIDVCEFLREEMSIAIPSFDQSGFRYEFDIPENEIYAMLDTILMSRVFQNLVENTQRYNQTGTNVMVRLLAQEDEITIIFTDDGVGIPVELTKDIFNPFVRVDNARNSQTGGTGLGLAIAKKIVEAHKGSICLETKINQGCEFIIKLPRN